MSDPIIMMTEATWPDIVWIVRHGESAATIARDAAEAAGLERIDLPARDADMPLSPAGREQAMALGRWIAAHPAERRPTICIASPYLRTRDTARIALESAGAAGKTIALRLDERLREREFGVLDGLTKAGIEARYPEQAELHESLGKFYHRPPGGESWCDVILRLRDLVGMLRRDYAGERVLLVAHQAVVFCMRYILEEMTEEEILAIDRRGDVLNCAVTWYEREGKRLLLRSYNEAEHLAASRAPLTASDDAGPHDESG